MDFLPGTANRQTYVLNYTNTVVAADNRIPTALTEFYPTSSSMMFMMWPALVYGPTYEIPKLQFMALHFGYVSFEGIYELNFTTWEMDEIQPPIPSLATDQNRDLTAAFNAELRESLEEYKTLHESNSVKYPKITDASDNWIAFPVWKNE